MTEYQYDVQDHLTRVTDAEGNTTTYQYSDRDLMTRESSPVSGDTSFTYNDHGELTATEDARPVTITRTVDALDRVTAVHYPTSSLDTTFTYDAAPAACTAGEGFLAGRPVAQRDSTTGNLLFLTIDHLGTPVLATDGAALEVWSGGFEPFGEDCAGARASGLFLRFPARWEDGAWEGASLGTGVYYNLHRWYEAGVARYTRPDPAFSGQILDAFAIPEPQFGGNSEAFYAYAGSNPVSFIDPRGLAAFVAAWFSPANRGVRSRLLWVLAPCLPSPGRNPRIHRRASRLQGCVRRLPLVGLVSWVCVCLCSGGDAALSARKYLNLGGEL